jgi:membrane-anchored protein YejM (alkaline phosphatase superfamily)
LTAYLICSWLFSIFLCTNFLQGIPNDTLRDQAHTLLVLLTYGLMYQAPAIISYWLLRRWRFIAVSAALGASILGHVLVFFDSKLFDLYGFHINGFVWNLVTSPGGIESLGADQTNGLVVCGYLAALAMVHLGGLLLSIKLPRLHIPASKLVMLFLLATAAERGVYGYSNAQIYGPVLERGDAMPLYQPMKMNAFLNRLGVEVKKSSNVKMEQAQGELEYPKHPIVLSKIVKPLNIIMLVSESMRWDLLTPEIMPNMTRFAQTAWDFTAHYSGGNGTRQGLFALFYGVTGNDWDLFLRHRQGPVFFDVLNNYNYQYFLYTGAKFTYPEFDQTIFSQIPKDRLIENSRGEPWVRDQDNTTALIDDIKNRDLARPYFGFVFYEATHARYSFSDDMVINENYSKTVDYAGLTKEKLAPQIEGLKARYENATHGIDMQLQRIVDYLEKSGEIDHTVVIITGDHGEEFMERGRWGHNSDFTDWQIRVPMIVRMPDSPASIITLRTSHMDVGPTILSRLGVQNQVKDYSLGVDMSRPEEHRNILVASWSDIGIVNDYGKLVIPFKSTTQHQNLATDLDDNPVNGSSLAEKMRTTIFQVMTDAKYYLQ